MGRYLNFYNVRRPRSSLDGMMPDQANFTPLPTTHRSFLPERDFLLLGRCHCSPDTSCADAGFASIMSGPSEALSRTEIIAFQVNGSQRHRQFGKKGLVLCQPHTSLRQGDILQICRANKTSSSTTEQEREEIEQLLALIIWPVGGTDTDGRLLRYRGGSGNGGSPCGGCRARC